MTQRSFGCFLANGTWTLCSLPCYAAFRRALGRVSATQQRYLGELIERNATTSFGQRYGFQRLGDVDDFRAKVPLTDYEDYLEDIEAIAAGQLAVLTTDPVRMFEPSSGTTSASKLIPYNAALKAELNRAIGPWIFSLFRHYPGALAGSSFWSITPPLSRERHHGMLPVGFDDDAEHLGPIARRLHGFVAAVHSGVIRAPSLHAFRNQTLVQLLAAADLSLVSVWSPTFLSVLLDHLIRNQDEILAQLAKSSLPRAAARAAELRGQIGKAPFDELWPGLTVLSCWADGPSQLYAEELRRAFERPVLQPKGLIATEAITSIPLFPDRDPVLAVLSHFFEFVDRKSGALRLAHELVQGQEYALVVTTGGGLYRYRTHDIVEVTGHIEQAPTLRFVAKEGVVADRCGEKLHLDHVQRALLQALAGGGLHPLFALVAPTERSGAVPAYTLFIAANDASTAQLQAAGAALEQLLEENFHYAHCRRLGQLGPLGIYRIAPNIGSPAAVYIEEMVRRGRRLGDIKPALLDRQPGWEQRFPGAFLDSSASESARA